MKIFFFLIPILTFQFASAQETNERSVFSGNERKKKEFHYYSLGGGISFSQYFGDLNQFAFSNLFKSRSTDVGISASLSHRFNPHMEWTFELSWIRLTADDYYNNSPLDPGEIFNYTRNLSFRNDMMEFNVQLKYFFIKNAYSYAERPFFSPYLFAGIGMLYQSPKARIPEFNLNNERNTNFGKWQSLRPLGTEGQFSEAYDLQPYSYLQPVIPLGLGINFKINNLFNINLEVSYRYVFTDYLDDVGGTYVDLGALNSDLARSFSDRSRELNSSNGRNPRNFAAIYEAAEPTIYVSKYNGQSYQVLNNYGNEGGQRGDLSKKDFYLLTGIKIAYILNGKKEK